jgi:hypothetical protein
LANVGESSEYSVNGLANVGESGESSVNGLANGGESAESCIFPKMALLASTRTPQKQQKKKFRRVLEFDKFAGKWPLLNLNTCLRNMAKPKKALQFPFKKLQYLQAATILE